MIEKIIEIAEGAGKILVDLFYSDRRILKLKEDSSPVTEADLASDKYILHALKSNFNIPFVSEESDVDYPIRKNWKEFFLVDPLDGTKDFIEGKDDFTVNIALIRNHKPVLGVISVPAINELFYAEEGRGAFLIRNGKHFKLPTTKCEPVTLARSRYHDNENLDEFARINSITHSRVMSSAIRCCRLAEGTANLYAGLNSSKEWDIAPGHILCKESGCRIIDLATRKEPVYNKPQIKNNFFVAMTKEVEFDKLIFPQP